MKKRDLFQELIEISSLIQSGLCDDKTKEGTNKRINICTSKSTLERCFVSNRIHEDLKIFISKKLKSKYLDMSLEELIERRFYQGFQKIELIDEVIYNKINESFNKNFLIKLADKFNIPGITEKLAERARDLCVSPVLN